MYYSASSVENSLKKNEKLSVRSNLKCPKINNDDWTHKADSEDCLGCGAAICQKASVRECKRHLFIDHNNANRTFFTPLSFSFIISKRNLDGYIMKKDDELIKLLDKKDMDGNPLVNKEEFEEISAL